MDHTETWVQTSDGLLGGFIDAIRTTANGVELVEFKTGKIFEQGQGLNPQIKRDYLDQLLLYCGLFFEQNGLWPVAQKIVSFVDGQFTVPIDVPSILSLMKQAKEMVAKTNCVIRREHNRSSLYRLLASPSSVSCRYCAYRPACSQYWDSRNDESGLEWPVDVRGEVQDTTRLGNGSQLISLMEVPTGQKVSLRWFDQSRYDFSDTVGSHLAFVNLIRHKDSNSYRESKMTSVYSVNI